MNIFTKFHKDWTTIVDFLLIAKFFAILLFFAPPSTILKKSLRSNNCNNETFCFLNIPMCPRTTSTAICRPKKTYKLQSFSTWFLMPLSKEFQEHHSSPRRALKKKEPRCESEFYEFLFKIHYDSIPYNIISHL